MDCTRRPTTALVLALLGGCWSVDSLPPPAPASCNNNGTCEFQKEDCDSCPADCPCCRAAEAVGHLVQDPEKATKNPDGESAVLGPDSSIMLVLGRLIEGNSGYDFRLVGQVTSESTVTVNALGCPTSAPTGGFIVETSLDGSIWDQVGFWTKDQSASGEASFELSCGRYSDMARYVRVSALPGQPAATLDALVAMHCME